MNSKIIGAVLIIAAGSIYRAEIAHQPITRIVIGAWVFLFLLAVMDFLGAAEIAGNLAILAALVVILDVFPWQSLISAVGGKQ